MRFPPVLRKGVIVVIAILMLAFGGWMALGIVQHLRHAPGMHQHQEKQLYYCPMHPSYTSDRPGNCPICNMKLVKRETTEMGAHEGGHGQVSGEISDHTAVQLTPFKQQLIGVKTASVQSRMLSKTIRTVGRVLVDETRIVHVHPKVEGWVGEVFARYEGDTVSKGQPLFSFYSPDFVATQEEYLAAWRMLQELPSTVGADVRAAAQENREAARRRLLWWDVTEPQIQQLEKQGKPEKYLVLTSPMAGVVLEKKVWPGIFMERGAEFFTIADLSSVWVEADLYELDLPSVQVGQEAQVILLHPPERIFRGKVVYVAPTVKTETRTAVARLEFANPQGILRPGIYLTAQIDVDLGERLAVPSEAILDTGIRQVAFIDQGEGRFEPRDLKVGAKAQGYTEIKEGLTEGEQVVVSGNFLIDSESRLKAALEGMAGGEHRHGQ